MVNDISAGLVRFKIGNGVSAFVQLPYVNEKKVITDFAKAKRAESQYFSQGVNNSASPLGFAAGSYLTADSSFAQVLGINACAPEGHDYSFVWNGDSSGTIGVQSYKSHGEGTFNVNPADGVNGFYIGNQTLSGILSLTCQPKGNYLSSNALDGYRTYDSTVSSLSSDGYATQAQLDAKSAVSVDNELADVNILHISREEYNRLVADDATLSNTVYIVSSDYVEAYGQQIKNVAPPTDLSDAVNKEYVDSSFQLKGNYLTAVPDTYKTYAATLSSLSSTYSLTSHTHSNYVPTSRTVAGMQLTGNITLKSLSFGSKSYNGSAAQTVTAGDLGALTAHQAVSAVYADQHIYLSANGIKVGDIDCTDFIKDGMLSTVELCSDQLIFSFNTDSEQDAISVTLSNFIDETQYWKKTETSSAAELSGAFVTVQEGLNNKLDIMIQIEYAELLDLVDNAWLVPGQMYRIIDYVTEVDQDNCRSAEHQFDLIVTALANDQLDENARATIHDGDTYFNAFEFPIPGYSDYVEMRRVPLEAWELKYCIHNDKQRFAFADTTNGKGVIYWMKDEFNNEAPYDFKNVQFYVEVGRYVGEVPYRDLAPDEDDEYWTWCYTFNGADYNWLLGANKPYDFSCWHPALKPQVTAATGIFAERLNICESNSIGSNINATPTGITGQSRFLLPNIFHCGLTKQQEFGELTLPFGMCIGNKIGDASFNNNFGWSAVFNRLGNNNYNNMFKYECSFNSLDDYCNGNMICQNSYYNTLGKNCSNNHIEEDCYHNTFGAYCRDNRLEYECSYNVFENNCYSNHIYYSSTANKLENGCYGIRLLVGYSTCIKVEQGCSNITLQCSQSTYYENKYKNVTIKSGVHDKTITDSNVNQSFCTTYQPANSQVIAI